jgi:hypothetical protein
MMSRPTYSAQCWSYRRPPSGGRSDARPPLWRPCGGWVPVEEVCRLYTLSVDALLAWESAISTGSVFTDCGAHDTRYIEIRSCRRGSADRNVARGNRGRPLPALAAGAAAQELLAKHVLLGIGSGPSQPPGQRRGCAGFARPRWNRRSRPRKAIGCLLLAFQQVGFLLCGIPVRTIFLLPQGSRMLSSRPRSSG